MHTNDLTPWLHGHDFGRHDEASRRRTIVVVALTAAMMVVEVAAGSIFGSMALLADGWHMGTHVAALSITVFAYGYARRHARDRSFSFGTGKVGVLGGFASAVALAVVALLMAAESASRLFSRPVIRFDESIAVAAVGLVVNLLSAFVLSAGGRHRHGDHEHAGHEHGHRVDDHNLRAAYLHVVADALTSVLAIVALSLGRAVGLVWLDPVVGLLGGAMIARWAYGLLRDTGRILLDGAVEPEAFERIRLAIEAEGDNRLSDLHVWRVSSDACAAVLSVVTSQPMPPEHYRSLLASIQELAHVSVEVLRCPGPTGPAPSPPVPPSPSR
jgi:cation diffusion facilitator family transporter